MRRVLAVVILVACSASAAAAPRRTVRGVVTEAGSGAPIPGASVLAEHSAGALTEADGSFVLEVDRRDRSISVVAAGYATRTIKIGNGPLQIAMQPASGGEVIEITGRAPDDTAPPSHQLTVDDIRTIPGAGNDILIFPQGTHARPEDERAGDPALRFRPGVGHLAHALAADVVPFGVAGTERVMPPDPSVFRGPLIAGVPVAIRRGALAIAFGPRMAIGPTETADAFAARLQDVCYALTRQAEQALHEASAS